MCHKQDIFPWNFLEYLIERYSKPFVPFEALFIAAFLHLTCEWDVGDVETLHPYDGSSRFHD